MSDLTDSELAYASASPDTNTYAPLSGGLESLWGLKYAIADPHLVPLAAHWYDESQGRLYADASLFYSRKQAEYLGVPFVWDKSRGQNTNFNLTRNVPVFFSGMSAFMAQCIANPHGINFKYLINGANSEDRQELGLYFRSWRKVIAMFKSSAWDGTNINWEALAETPMCIDPGSFLTKIEMVAMLMQTDPKLMELVWTCVHPTSTLKVGDEIVGYEACGKCWKCLEYTNALTVASEANVRYSAGVEYYAKFKRHEFKTRNRTKTDGN